MKLIKEDTDFRQILVEKKGAKGLFIKGPFLQSEKINRNGRVYPQHIMDGAVSTYITEYVDKKRALGELNHPAEPQVNPERAAIMTESLKKDGIYYVGRAKVLSTPCGKIVESLINDGVQLGVSSRGLGTLKQKPSYSEVQEDFVLTTAADVVFDPSAQSSFVEGVFEQAEWIYESGAFKQVTLDEWHYKLLNAKKAQLNEVKLELFQDFLNSL